MFSDAVVENIGHCIVIIYDTQMAGRIKNIHALNVGEDITVWIFSPILTYHELISSNR